VVRLRDTNPALIAEIGSAEEFGEPSREWPPHANADLGIARELNRGCGPALLPTDIYGRAGL
jgi:hypothetical protein